MTIKKGINIFFRIILGLLALLFAGAVILFFATSGNYSVSKTVADDASIPHIELNGATFHAETFGTDTSQVVIVIHGGPGNDYRSLLTLKDLYTEYYVVFYDQRGTGLSPRVDAVEHSLETSLADLTAIVDYYSPNRKVNLIGHSWGAMLASGYIAQHPERVNKAVLAEPGMLTSAKAAEYFKSFQIKPSWALFKSLTVIAFESLHIKNAGKQARLDYIFGKIATLDTEENPMRKYFCNNTLDTAAIRQWRPSAIASASIVGKVKDKNGQIQIDLASGVEKFTNKVLFLSGECNSLIGPEFQKDHISLFTDAQLIVLPNAGHAMITQQPEASLNAIRKYFEE